VMSYLGHLDFGIIADRRQMPDVADLMGWLDAELRALLPRRRVRSRPAIREARGTPNGGPPASGATPRAKRRPAAG
jgi:hypothetical protein